MVVRVQVPPLLPHLHFNSFFIMFGAIKHLIPSLMVTWIQINVGNVGLTWIDQEGLTDFHNLQIQYVRNNERLAIECGEPQPDGSWAYKESNGTVHTMSAERVNAFMAKTQEHATIMCFNARQNQRSIRRNS